MAKRNSRSTKKAVSNELKITAGVQNIYQHIRPLVEKYHRPKTTYLAIALIGLALLIASQKSWFIAATVNNSPISNLEVLSRLNEQYRKQTLNQMINEKIILDETKKRKIIVSESEINNRVSSLEKNVGGSSSLDSLLASQGQTRARLRDQLRIQLAIEKMYASEATVSSTEVSKFTESNKGQLQATDSAGQTREAEEILRQQKLSTVFNTKFQELKTAAKVRIF